jgi:hypothetical protein
MRIVTSKRRRGTIAVFVEDPRINAHLEYVSPENRKVIKKFLGQYKKVNNESVFQTHFVYN